MYPFLTSNNDPVGIGRDHRAFYDIMRRLKSMFDLNVDLSELLALGEAESQELVDTLEKIASTNPTARELIERAKTDFNYTPFETVVSLDPALDRTLEDILRNATEPPEGT
jgi:ABC-type transporter Mla subunit MlaD